MYFGISFVFLRCFRVYHLEFISGVFFVRLGLGFQVHEWFAAYFRFFHSSCHWFQHAGCKSQILAINLLHLRLARRFLGHFFKTTDRYFLGIMRHVRDRLLSSSGHVLMGHRFWSEDLLVPTLGSLACVGVFVISNVLHSKMEIFFKTSNIKY